MGLKLTLNVNEDEALRDYVKDLIKGQVRSILKDEIKGMIFEWVKEEGGKNKIDIKELVRKEVKDKVTRMLNEYSAYANSTEITRIARDEIKQILGDMFRNNKVV